jgi:hypothetical protein
MGPTYSMAAPTKQFAHGFSPLPIRREMYLDIVRGQPEHFDLMEHLHRIFFPRQ